MDWEQEDDGSVVIVDQIGCARCHGEGHAGLRFKRLEHPVTMPHTDVEATHWAMCPTNNEPILMMFVAKESVSNGD